MIIKEPDRRFHRHRAPMVRFASGTPLNDSAEGTMADTEMNPLTQLHADIDARTTAIRSRHHDWPCRPGCDGCCRRLAEVPRIAASEWDWLREGLARLRKEELREIGLAILALAARPSRPMVCPLLDRTAGVCRVYAHRPVACRTYGFYVQRNRGLYCREIESRVADGDFDNVVWGNHEVIDRRLQALGETRELTEWFACWSEAPSAPPNV